MERRNVLKSAGLVGVAALPKISPLKTTLPSAGCRIWCVGDSITAGYAATAWQYTYRGRLWPRSDFTISAVKLGTLSDGGGPHDGHVGWTIPQLQTLVDANLASMNPDLVLLHAGTNDAVTVNGSVIIDRLTTLMNTILSGSSAKIIVAKHNPSYHTAVSEQIRSVNQKQFNAFLPGAVGSFDPTRVRWVDFSQLTYNMTADGFHPNNYGYDVMSYFWYDQIQRFTPNGFLPNSAIDLPFMPLTTGSA